MLILVTGPIGAVKTELSYGLLKVFNQMVILNGEWFAAMQPFSWDKKSDVATVYQSLALMIQFHEKLGKTRFVLILNYQMAIQIKEFLPMLNPKQMPVRAFRLRCSDDQLQHRSQLSNLENKNTDMVNLVRQQKLFDGAFLTNIPFMVVDVTHLNEQETVRRVRTMINEYDKLLKVA